MFYMRITHIYYFSHAWTLCLYDQHDTWDYFSDVRKDIIDMDRINGNRIVHTSHPGHRVFVRKQPVNVRGWFKNGVRLNSREKQYIDVGANATCQGNLNRCNNGFTLRYRLKPGSLQNNQYWHSSAPYDIYYKQGKVHAVFRTPTHIWSVSTDQFSRNSWNLFDFSWHADEGLIMYVDGKEVAANQTVTVNHEGYDINQPMYIGKDMGDTGYGDFDIDDVQLWEAKRAILIRRRLINATDPRDPGKTADDGYNEAHRHMLYTYLTQLKHRFYSYHVLKTCNS